MLAGFRAFYKSPAAVVLMGLLVFSFAIWGVKDAFHTRISDDVIKAGSRRISTADFKNRFEQALQQLQKQTGQTVTPQQAVDQGAVGQMLQDLASAEAVQEAIRRSGVQPSDNLVIQELRKIPAFFNPVSGRFDQQTYQTLLNQNGLTAPMFEQQMRDDISTLHFTSGMMAGFRAPLTYAALYAGLDQQSRSADFFVLDQHAVPMPAKPTDAQLTQLMNSFAAQLRRPEMRQLSLVRISAQAIEPTLQPKPADVQKQFDAEKAQLGVPERRSFVQIPAKDAAQAQAMAARLTKGEDPSSVARSYGVKPISYADTPLSAVADPKVGQAVFAMQAGQSSGPIQGAGGYAVVKLASITPARPATLEEARPQIAKVLNAQAAQQQAYDQSEKYADAHAAGQPMAQASKAAGVQIYTLPPLSADGKDLNKQPVPSLTAKMLTDAFALPQGGETDLVDLGKGEYYAIRVDKVTPPSLPSLDEIRGPLTNLYMQRELVNALRTRADALAARERKGESLQAVAASAGAKVTHIDVTRASASQPQQQALGQEFLGRLFQAKPGEVFNALGVNFGMAVAKLNGVQSGSVADVAREAVSLRAQLTDQMGRGEFGEVFEAAARAKVKPRVDEKLAYQAIGVTPQQTPASIGKASGKAK
jgi:peptidyl-prolyl cis-trans isomerase D